MLDNRFFLSFPSSRATISKIIVVRFSLFFYSPSGAILNFFFSTVENKPKLEFESRKKSEASKGEPSVCSLALVAEEEHIDFAFYHYFSKKFKVYLFYTKSSFRTNSFGKSLCFWLQVFPVRVYSQEVFAKKIIFSFLLKLSLFVQHFCQHLLYTHS